MESNKERSIPIGISPIGWINDDIPDMGNPVHFEKCLDEIALCGYEGCEIGGTFPKNPEILLNHLEKRDLRACNKWFNFNLTGESLDQNLDRLYPHVQLLKHLRCQVVGGGEIGNNTYRLQSHSGKKRIELSSLKQWVEFCEKLNVCGRIIKENGLRLAFHPHVGTIIESLDDVKRLLDLTDPELVFINYDSGHTALAGEDPLEVLQICEDRIIHVHLKNMRPIIYKEYQSGNWNFLKAVREGIFTVPGDPSGCIDFVPIIQSLSNFEYNGWLVVEAEQDPSIANPLHYARMAYDYLMAIGANNYQPDHNTRSK